MHDAGKWLFYSIDAVGFIYSLHFSLGLERLAFQRQLNFLMPLAMIKSTCLKIQLLVTMNWHL